VGLGGGGPRRRGEESGVERPGAGGRVSGIWGHGVEGGGGNTEVGSDVEGGSGGIEGGGAEVGGGVKGGGSSAEVGDGIEVGGTEVG
jgi:hypothetical protein